MIEKKVILRDILSCLSKEINVSAECVEKIVECMVEKKINPKNILSYLSKNINVPTECMEKIVGYMYTQKVEPQEILAFLKKQNISLDPIVEKYFFTYDTEKSGGSKTEEPLLSKLKISGVDDLCKAKAPVDLIASIIKDALNGLNLVYGEEIRFTIENLVNKMLCCDYSLGCVSAILKPIKDKVKSFGKVQLEEILINCRFNTDQISYFSNEIFPPPPKDRPQRP